MKRTCVQCGKPFELSEAGRAIYEQKRLPIPDQCYHCRRANRIRRNTSMMPRGQGKGRKNRPGIGRAAPGMLSIFLLLAVYMLGRPSMVPDGGRRGGATATHTTVESRAYIFRNFDLLVQNFEQYGKKMGYDSAEQYLEAANEVISDPDSLHSQEGGEDVYERGRGEDGKKEQVVVSADGFITRYCYKVK